MGVLEMIVLIVLIKSLGDVAEEAFKAAAARKRSVPDRVEAELVALRQEVAALRASTHDLILSFDSTLHEQDRRLQSLERHSLTVDGFAPPAGIFPGQTGAQPPTTPEMRKVRRQV